MRRRVATDDPLDLFLDTICNMFGGIIVVMLLLVLLSFGRAKAVISDAGLSTAQQSMLVQQHRERGQLESQKKVLEDALNVLIQDSDRIRESAPPGVWDEIQAVLEQIEAAERQLAKYNRFRQELEERRLSTQQRLAEQDQSEVDIKVALELAQQEQDLIIRSQTVEARLPVTRHTTKRPVWIMLQNSRGYLLYAVRGGINTPEDRDVEMQHIGEGNLFTAKESGGFLISSSVANEQRWLEMLQDVDAERQQLVFAVYPDSYEAFLFIKTAALRAGLQYDVVPMGESDAMELGPGTHDTTQ